MPRNLAITTFVSGPNDKTATVDVYSTTTTDVINLIPPISIPLEDTIQNSLRGSASMTSALPGLSALSGGLNAVKGTMSIGASLSAAASQIAGIASSGASLLSRISSISSVVGSTLKSIGTSQLNSLIGTATSVLGGLVGGGSASVNIGGVISNIAPSNISQASSAAGLLGSLTGNSSLVAFTDNGAQTALYSSALSSAMNAGIPGTFQPTLNAAGITSLPQINSIASGCMPSIIASSDITSLSQVASMTSPGAMNALQPNLVQDFSSNFTAPVNQTANQSVANFQTMSTSFSSINSSWNSTTRTLADGTIDTVTDLSVIQNGSPAFQSAAVLNGLNTTNTTQQLYVAATVLPATDVSTEINTQFPDAVPPASSATSSSTSSPTTNTPGTNTKDNSSTFWGNFAPAPDADPVAVSNSLYAPAPAPAPTAGASIATLTASLTQCLNNWQAACAAAKDRFDSALHEFLDPASLDDTQALADLQVANNLRINAQNTYASQYLNLCNQIVASGGTVDPIAFPATPPGTNLAEFTFPSATPVG